MSDKTNIPNRDEEKINPIITSNNYSLHNKLSWDDRKLQAYLIDYLENLYKGKTVIVTLIGAPASGKSTLVKHLTTQLNNKGHLTDSISTDGFSMYSRKERNERIANGAYPLDLKDLTLNKKIVESVRRGEKIKAPIYNELTGDAIAAPLEDWHELPQDLHFLIEEGDLQPIDDPDMAIYLHLPTDVRRENRVERDLAKRDGYGDAEDIRKSFDGRLETQYYPYTLPNAEKADILIIAQAHPEPINREYHHKYTYSVYIKNKIY